MLLTIPPEYLAQFRYQTSCIYKLARLLFRCLIRPSIMPDGRPGSTTLHCFAFLDNPRRLPLSSGHVVFDAILSCPLETPEKAPILCSLRCKNNASYKSPPKGWYHILAKVCTISTPQLSTSRCMHRSSNTYREYILAVLGITTNHFL